MFVEHKRLLLKTLLIVHWLNLLFVCMSKSAAESMDIHLHYLEILVKFAHPGTELHLLDF